MSTDAPIRRRAVWDIVLSIVLLVFAVLTGFVGAFIQLFVLAFTDDCPRSTCDIDEAVGGVFVVWALIGLLVVASIVITIVLLARRHRAWWVALIGWLVTVAGAVVGFVIYASATGYAS